MYKTSNGVVHNVEQHLSIFISTWWFCHNNDNNKNKKANNYNDYDSNYNLYWWPSLRPDMRHLPMLVRLQYTVHLSVILSKNAHGTAQPAVIIDDQPVTLGWEIATRPQHQHSKRTVFGLALFSGIHGQLFIAVVIFLLLLHQTLHCK